MEKITSTEEKNNNIKKLELQNISRKAKNNNKKKQCQKDAFNMIIVGMTACGKTKFLLIF